MAEPASSIADTHHSSNAPDDSGQAGGISAADDQLASWTNSHPVNIRLSIPLIFMRCYVVVVAGKERRDAERRVSERQKHPLMTVGNVTFLSALSALLGLAALALINFAWLHVLTSSGDLLRP